MGRTGYQSPYGTPFIVFRYFNNVYAISIQKTKERERDTVLHTSNYLVILASKGQSQLNC